VNAAEVFSLDRSSRPQRRSRNRLTISTAALLIALSLNACAETPAEKAQRLDPILSAAGFQMVQPTTQQKQGIFASMPPLKMNYYVGKDGQARYWFADPYQCNCVFKGDAKAYQQYQNLRIQQRIAEEQEEAAALNQDAALQMNTFDPFFFPY
jgi:hypothetical protein